MYAQTDLLGIKSYSETRKPVKGTRTAVAQLDMFRNTAKKASPESFKKGEKFIVAETGLSVTFLRQLGTVSLWESAGETYRATAAQVASVTLKRIH